MSEQAREKAEKIVAKWNCDLTALFTVADSEEMQKDITETILQYERELEELRAIKAEKGRHECGCEVCSTISTLCPATSSSYALEIITLRTKLDECVKVMEPFAEAATEMYDPPGTHDDAVSGMEFSVGEIRQLAATLAKVKGTV